MRVQSDLADALDKSVLELDGRRRAGQSAWEGDMPVKVCPTHPLNELGAEWKDVKPVSTCSILSTYPFGIRVGRVSDRTAGHGLSTNDQDPRHSS